MFKSLEESGVSSLRQYFTSNHISSEGAIYLRHLLWHYNDTVPKQYLVLLELHITQRRLESPGKKHHAAQLTFME